MNNMYNEIEEKIYFNPGDLVMVRHEIPNRPIMFVVEKVMRSLINKDTSKGENIFLGIKCRWFDVNQVLHEELFSTKDLIHI